jgi:hypothetical protein
VSSPSPSPSPARDALLALAALLAPGIPEVPERMIRGVVSPDPVASPDR